MLERLQRSLPASYSVQIRAVGRQIEDRGAGRGDRLAHAIDLVRRQIVAHHDVTGFERGREALLDIGAKRGAGDRAVRHDAGLPEPAMKVVVSGRSRSAARNDFFYA
jgi:hypothetical protein